MFRKCCFFLFIMLLIFSSYSSHCHAYVPKYSIICDKYRSCFVSVSLRVVDLFVVVLSARFKGIVCLVCLYVVNPSYVGELSSVMNVFVQLLTYKRGCGKRIKNMQSPDHKLELFFICMTFWHCLVLNSEFHLHPVFYVFLVDFLVILPYSLLALRH